MSPAPSVTTRAGRTPLREHMTLRQLLAQVITAFGGATALGATGPDVVAARLDTLRGPLHAHFDEEERAGVFERLEQRAPEQASACAALRREHDRLLQRLDSLRRATPVERRSHNWTRGVRAFIDEMRAHEQREAELLDRVL
jgi:hypothetical protein